MKIGVVGLGVVGQAITDGFEYLEHEVFVHDTKFNDSDIAGLTILSKYVILGLPAAILNSCFKEEPSEGTNEHSLIINLFSIIL